MIPTMDRANYAVGIALLLVVVFLWTFSSFLTQNLLTTGYNKPFLITYLNTSTFSLYLIPHLIRLCLRRTQFPKTEASRGDYSSLPPSPPIRGRPLSTDRRRSAHSLSPPHLPLPLEPDPLAPLTVRETANLAAIFCLLWFVANWTVNASLEFTSVASSTILASMSGFFTLAIGRLFGVESFTLAKLLAVAASFSGILLVSLSDSSPPPSPTASDKPSVLIGDLLALLSALFYAFYVTFLKVRTKHESRLDAQLFFGFVGLFNGVCLWPLGFVLHWSGWEVFQMPPDWMAWAGVLLNMAITVSSDYLYVLAMLKTTPLVVTVGLSLTIPLAVLGDFWLGRPAALQTLAGAVLVLGAFGAVGWESVRDAGAEGGGGGARTPRELETTYGAVSPIPSPVESEGSA